MAVWVIFAAMTALAALAVLAPLASARAGRGASDVEVYRDQLAEVERDRAAGLLAPAEADAARIEVSRRLLAAAARAESAAASADAGATRRRRIVAVAALLIVPATALGVYGLRGQPNLPAMPLADRLAAPPSGQDVAALVARIETHLAANPQDGRGWEILAPVYVRMGRYGEAVRARAAALRLLGATPDREADHAEALVLEAQGVVTAAAKEGFQRALAADAANPKARYFVALALEQDGKRAEAATGFAALLAAAPADAPWRALVEAALQRVGGAPASPAADAIVSLPAGDQAAAIRGMVEGLARRLAGDGADFDGWLRLVRAYAVLGEADKARAAASDARRHFAAEADKMSRLDALLKELGMDG